MKKSPHFLLSKKRKMSTRNRDTKGGEGCENQKEFFAQKKKELCSTFL